MDIKSNIRHLRIIAFFLFFVTTFALIGSLVVHNTLLSFPFSHEVDYKLKSNSPGTTTPKFQCNKGNEYCRGIYKKTNKLDKCNIYHVDQYVLSGTGEILSVIIFGASDDLQINNIEKVSKESNKKIITQWKISENVNKDCIKNSNLIKFYKFAPIIFEKIYELRISEKTQLGTGSTVNPLIYGETSISNIVKRFPIKFIFKPLMYIGIILMIFYWYYNNLIINKILGAKIHNKFYVFGVLSAIFLLLHVFFLGWVFESEILTKIRRSFIIFFILFEVLAQTYLIKDIFKKKLEIFKFLNNFVIYCKLIFVFFVCTSTIAILIILLITNLDSKVDYILEWNYFLILLIFYLLSSIMWKKN